MFDRDILDTQFVKRWGIVRTLRDQSIAEHMYIVTHYANDICVFFDIDPEVHLSVLQHTIFHDVDEIITTDIPGPNKRALLSWSPEARHKWNQKLKEWTERIFPQFKLRSGERMKRYGIVEPLILSIVKVADWMEAVTFLGTEIQMGNQNAGQIIVRPNFEGALAEAKNLLSILERPDMETEFIAMLHRAMHDATNGRSKGPDIAL